MGSKKKRKSAAPPEEQPPKRPSSQQARRSGGSGGGSSSVPLAWGPDGVTATLAAHQALVFAGRATLAVLSGEVSLFGGTVNAASGPVELAADERCGGTLLMEPGAAASTVPLAASGPAAVLTLTRAAGGASAGPPSTPAGDSTAGAAAAARARHVLGFQVWLASDPAAPAPPPPLPPLWQQAAGEITASIQQQQQQQQGGVCIPGIISPVIAVCGPKKVGKSTFARLLVNSLLSCHPCVTYLDTDCGQPEFTAPGLVSLSLVSSPVVGPPHLHQRRPAAALFVGDVSPAPDPVRYLQCVRELHSWHCQHGAAAAAAAARGDAPAQCRGASSPAGQAQQQQEQQQEQAGGRMLPPLVVNTHGWVKGMGFDVLGELLGSLPVTHLVQLAAANPKKNLPPGAFWLPDPADGGVAAGPHPPAQPLQWVLPGVGEEGGGAAQPAVSDTSARSAVTGTGGGPAASEGNADGGGRTARGRVHAVEQRALQWEALAQQCADACGLSPAQDGGSGKGAAGAAAADDLGDRLAAAVPYVVDTADLEVQVLHSSVPPSQLFRVLNGAVVGLCRAPPPQPQQTQQPLCLGLGIVRAADAAARRLHILTAVPEEELECVALLQLGRLELPASLLQTGGHMSPYLALHSLSSAGTGAGAIRSRNNLLRASQL